MEEKMRKIREQEESYGGVSERRFFDNSGSVEQRGARLGSGGQS